MAWLTIFLIFFAVLLIIAAKLSANPNTRAIGRWVFGGAIVAAFVLPVYLSFSGHSSAARPLVGLAAEPVVQRSQAPRLPSLPPPPAAMPAPAAENFAFGPVLLIVGLIVLFGVFALIRNADTRAIGLGVAGVVAVLALVFLFYARTEIVQHPPQMVRMGSSEAIVAQEESHMIPVEEAPVKAPVASEPTSVAAPQPESHAAVPPAAAPPAVPTPAPAAAPRSQGNAEEARPDPATAAQINSSNLAAPMKYGDTASRPDWVKQRSGILTDGTVYSVVSVGPYAYFDECLARSTFQLDEAISNHLGSIRDRGLRLPTFGLPQQLRDEAIAEYYLEQRDHSFGEMVTLHTRLDFTPTFYEKIRAWQAEELADTRLIFTALSAAIVVGFVAIAYGYFRLDTATRGYYTWRLRAATGLLVAGLAIAAIATVALYFEQESRLGGINF